MNIQQTILEAVKSHVYIPLEHKEMHSCLCSDLVQRKEFLHNSAHNKISRLYIVSGCSILPINISIAACFQLDVELVGLGGLVMLSQGSESEVVSKLATRQDLDGNLKSSSLTLFM